MHSSLTMGRVKCGLDNSAVGLKPGALILVAFSALLLAAVSPAHAQTETLLYSFGCQPGCFPSAGLIMNMKGNLYGTTSDSSNGYGTVFEVTPSGTETVLHVFLGPSLGDGADPTGRLIRDKKGNLYGTTLYGGLNLFGGGGTVFEVTPSGTETVLYRFNSESGDGYHPVAGLVMDKLGNLYGTTTEGGAYGEGIVFKITPSGTETVLYGFGSQSGDGSEPVAGLVIDRKGNLYGTTVFGGANGLGTVFKVTPSGSETVLYSFGSQSGDGADPEAGLLMDKQGNFYGTTYSGGAYNYGTVYKLSASGTESVLYSFTGKFKRRKTDGANPYADLIMDKEGNLYGATEDGPLPDLGAVFQLTPYGRLNILHDFIDGTGDGLYVYGGLVMDKQGNLYGTTTWGGAFGRGIVFRVTP